MTAEIPDYLYSLAEITKAMRVGKKRIKKWCKMTPPPPIAIEGEGGARRYSAEFYRLQEWREKVFSPKN